MVVAFVIEGGKAQAARPHPSRISPTISSISHPIGAGRAESQPDCCHLRQRELERFSAELNRLGFTRRPFSDSRSVLAKEAGMDGPSFIA
jgi:hypothetical protein